MRRYVPGIIALAITFCILIYPHLSMTKAWPVVEPGKKADNSVITPILAIAASVSQPEELKESFVTPLCKSIEKHKLHPVLGTWVRQVIEHSPTFVEDYQEARQISLGLSIDVILQDHGAGDISSLQPSVLESQTLARKILDQEAYDAIGMEGSNLVPITISGLAQQVVQHSKEQGHVLQFELALESVVDTRITSACVSYLYDNPNSLIIGTEYQPLNRLHSLVIGQIHAHLSHARDPNLIDLENLLSLNLQLSRMRSEVALCAMIRYLRKSHKERGAIVIGFDHASDMQALIVDFSLGSRIFNTSLTE